MKRYEKISKDLIIGLSIGIGVISLIPVVTFFLGCYLMGW